MQIRIHDNCTYYYNETQLIRTSWSTKKTSIKMGTEYDRMVKPESRMIWETRRPVQIMQVPNDSTINCQVFRCFLFFFSYLLVFPAGLLSSFSTSPLSPSLKLYKGKKDRNKGVRGRKKLLFFLFPLLRLSLFSFLLSFFLSHLWRGDATTSQIYTFDDA